ncbi:ABC-type glycerol-3-phosphate transport system, substrate-binding protein [Anaerovirgula multivorans]|uniref:ABC-type glycerol-3-phosphate transport system, substrate-binding protein n=1 Tax=Anaerovirgula multivorans TaxID=312168 RepID=A0A239IIM0_9FIRM|nr:extracellular solute-binding protein [Anaerovirgula multivorans]SNS93500.1 ABC-type glycerol-3-phosphate transport system, substrate-binding protein [Anaerovirgula multivorans]
MFKKVISFLMIGMLTLSLAACSAGNKSTSQEPSIPAYTEMEIGSNSGLMWPGGSRVNSKNQLVFFDRGYEANSGFVTLEQNGDLIDGSQISFLENVSAFTLDKEDNIYAVTTASMENSIAQKLTVLSPQGDILKNVELGTFSSAGGNGMQRMGFTDIAVDANGYIYLSNPSQHIQVLDKEGQGVRTLGSEGYESIDMDFEGNLIALNIIMGKRAIEKLDVSTGRTLWSNDLSQQNTSGFSMMGSNKIRSSKEDDSIYYLTSQNISKYDSSGNHIGTVIDFKAYTILASGYNISDMSIDAEGNIYVAATSLPAGAGRVSIGGGSSHQSANPADSIKYELYKYSVQSGEITAPKQEIITVSVPVSNRTLEIAASKFQRENPGYRIDIQIYPSGDYETYIRNLNTQILSGKGPDVISLGGLPYENYISRNVLADIGEMMDSDNSFDMSKYHTNIFDALKTNGGLYVLPIDFTFNVLMANQAILNQESIIIDDRNWTWNDFKSIAEKVTQKNGNGGNRTALPSVTSVELLNLFTRGSYSNYIDADRKNANFTSEGFMDLLKTIKAFDEENLTNSNVDNNMVSILEAAGREAIVFYPYNIIDYNLYGFMKSAFKEQLSLYNMPSSGDANVRTFSSNSMYGINRNSDYKAEGWEFLKILLSDEIQSQSMQGGAMQTSSGSNALGGFSVNKAAQQQRAQQAIDASQGGNMRIMLRSGDGSISLSSAPMAQTDIEYINEFIAGLNTYANIDANITSIIQDETRGFFSGNKSVEETAKLIQDRVNTYLKE